MTHSEILENLLKRAVANLSAKKQKKYSKIIVTNIDILLDNIDNNKSLVSALTTSLLEKTVNPQQDVRLHKKKFENGYSARVLDTKVTTPFFKKYFQKYSNKESGFLSLVTRADTPWTLSEGTNIATRTKKELLSFLEILDAVENTKIKAKDTLMYIFEKLHTLSLQQKMIFDETIETSDFIDIININSVLSMLHKHFSMKLSSRLPVIAIYSIYQQLFKQVKRYYSKILRPLNVHTSADKHGYGDIEVWNKNDTPFEIVEIKHNISIDRNLVFDVAKKSENTGIERYYILTTAKDNFVSTEEEEFIKKFTLKIQKNTNLDIIANGIFTTLKYYLRFIDDYKEFIKTYTTNLVADSKKSTEIKEFHILGWQNILKKHKLC
ncbi:MAG: restriction endonuclease, SacI family [Prevotellaceae bacterium]|jgi:DNA (cytosine-5)-methyltransferase 1|nr:restriction endonuclease, SacI family [Prevotellaceae bacterium]